MLVWIKYFFKKGKNELERGTSTSFQLEPLELVQCGSGGQWSRSSTSPRRPSPVMAEKCCWLSRKSRSLGSSTEAKQIHGSLRNYSKLWLSIFHNQSINQSINHRISMEFPHGLESYLSPITLAFWRRRLHLCFLLAFLQLFPGVHNLPLVVLAQGAIPVKKWQRTTWTG